MRIYLKQAFRPLFPLTALYGALGISVWLLGLSGVLPLPPQATLWHAHEMLFGFAAALIAGFALTAVENWTHAKRSEEHTSELQSLMRNSYAVFCLKKQKKKKKKGEH